MTTEKMREEFKAAFKKQFGFEWVKTTPVTDDGDAAVMETALWAWQASRAALVIELPAPAVAGGNCIRDHAIRDVLEAAGLKVKP